ncbi:helix-hairpin-helix domain-containing protein [Micromonospora eburnea]|uniref:Helix-hairpin-helix motif-containing protein n=1 Tax=Micromonospora eburnea TaxID=227316 RepID=A0A1C6TV71_9ACTN|nr:helix-hairpin-helix domain-containing protein [Micromonospora eburnea]SCL45706.1 Helix-hairpin-helix motif-containing protein [Micromonospora eburnea]
MSTAPDGGWPAYPAGSPPAAYGPGLPATPVTGGPPNPGVDGKWRLLHSWWLLLPILGCGCLGGFGFIYVGLRTRRPAWWISGIGYALLGWAAFATVGEADKESVLSNVATAVMLMIWIGGIVHALLINSAWLRWQATHRPWYQQPTGWSATGYPPGPLAPPPVPAPTPATWPSGSPTTGGFAPAPPGAPDGFAPPGSPVAGGFASPGGPMAGGFASPVPPGVGVPAQASPPAASWDVPQSGSTVDVNTVDAAQLTTLPGFDATRVHRVLVERERRRGFGSVAEFVAAAELAPHEYARLRDVLVCVPPAGPATPGQPHGRVLDF